MAPPVPVPNARATADTIANATITYSNDTTPSLSSRKSFKASVVLIKYSNTGHLLFYTINSLTKINSQTKMNLQTVIGRADGGLRRAQSRALLDLRMESGGKLSENCGDRSGQGVFDGAASSRTERKSHCGNDRKRGHHVLERYDAVLVVAQTLKGFRGLDVIFQHSE